MCTSHRWAPSGGSSHTAADFGTISTSSEQLLTMQRPHLSEGTGYSWSRQGHRAAVLEGQAGQLLEKETGRCPV